MPRLGVIGTHSPSNVAPHPRKETPDFDLQIIRVYHRLQEETTTADRPFHCLGNDCYNSIIFSYCFIILFRLTSCETISGNLSCWGRTSYGVNGCC